MTHVEKRIEEDENYTHVMFPSHFGEGSTVEVNSLSGCAVNATYCSNHS